MIQRQRLVHKFPKQKRPIQLLCDFCCQPDTEFHFSEREFTELCDWLVHQDDDGAEAFWEEFSDAFWVGDSAVSSLLRQIIPKTEKRGLSFIKIVGDGFMPAIRRILLLS